MKKFLSIVLMTLVSFMANAQTFTHADDKDYVIDSLKTVIENLEYENDSLSWELRKCQYEIYSLKSNNDGLPYGTKRLSTPVPFEDSKYARFKVFQSLDGYALAYTGENHSYGWTYYGAIVVLVGNCYDEQIVKIKNPMIVGRYTYTSKDERERTVPVILPKE